VEETNVNKKSVQTRRDINRNSEADNIIDSFDPADSVLTVHWDGKIVEVLQGREKQDRQAVIVTGETTNPLLGVPAVPDGKAIHIAHEVVGLLKKWGAETITKAMSFDTTNVNASGAKDKQLSEARNKQATQRGAEQTSNSHQRDGPHFVASHFFIVRPILVLMNVS